MRATNKSALPLILEMALIGACVCAAFAYALFHFSFGDFLPDAIKIGAPLGAWVAGLAFCIAHMNSDGRVEFKVWREK